MTERHTVDSITSDALDTLYDERDQYAAAIKQLILQVKWTAHVWATTLPDTIPTDEVTRALSFLCSPVPLPDDLRDDLWQQIQGAYYVRFENDGHPEDATAAADIARAIVQPELDRLTVGQDHTCPDGQPCPGHDEPATA